LGIEPTGLDIGREFAHDFGKGEKDLLELFGVELSLPRHAGASAVSPALDPAPRSLSEQR
jgi:hypothetical protein